MEFGSEITFSGENSIAHEQYPDDELGLDHIKQKKFDTQCILNSGSNSEGEHREAIKHEPKTIDLTSSMISPEKWPEIGSDMSEMIENLLQSRPSGNSSLQCSECDLECPSRQALEFHTKLHVMERIVQSSYNHPEIGLKGTCNVTPNDAKTTVGKIIKKPKIKKRKIKNKKGKNMKIKNPKIKNRKITKRTHSEHRPFECKECDSRFKTKYYFEAHMLTHLPSDCTQNSKSKNIIIKSPKIDNIDPDKKTFKCKECDSRFKTKQYFEGHMLTHRTLKCTQCEYRCSKKGLLTRHMLIHTGTKHHECSICDYRCNDKGNLAKHMMTHIDDKPFSCPEEGCDYKCKFKCNLKFHAMKHSGEKPYGCKLCDYRTTTNGSLTTHMFKHSGERPFPCSVCDHRSASKSDLKVHERIHTNNKPFKCQLCDYRSYTRQHVDQHMLTHTGERPHKCEECGSRFTSSSSLKKHMRTHGIFILPRHSMVSNAVKKANKTVHQVNTQPLNNQHVIENNSSMGGSSQETTYPNVNYKMFTNNMDYHSFTKMYNNFSQSAKPLWHQGSSTVNTDGYNCAALSDKLMY